MSTTAEETEAPDAAPEEESTEEEAPTEEEEKPKSRKRSRAPYIEPQVPILREGTWVRLGGDNVPDHAQGHLAEIVRAPISIDDGTGKGALSPRPHERQAEDAWFLVLTRDDAREYLELQRDSFMEISTNGRAALTAHG